MMKLGLSKTLGITLGVLALAVTACGDEKDVVMPDVTTKRLDIALSDIERAGFEDEVEVLGGGMFGVVDESNWTVCDQEPKPGTPVAGAPRLTVDRTCDGADDLQGEETEPAEEGAAEAGGNSRPNDEDDSTPSDAGDTFVMPALVGMNLQAAQDSLQALGSYILTQTDATGMDRFQMLDSNWKVCRQAPEAGSKVPLSHLVDLGAVKLNESCP
jgi:hypothetical protein